MGISTCDTGVLVQQPIGKLVSSYNNLLGTTTIKNYLSLISYEIPCKIRTYMGRYEIKLVFSRMNSLFCTLIYYCSSG